MGGNLRQSSRLVGRVWSGGGGKGEPKNGGARGAVQIWDGGGGGRSRLDCLSLLPIFLHTPSNLKPCVWDCMHVCGCAEICSWRSLFVSPRPSWRKTPANERELNGWSGKMEKTVIVLKVKSAAGEYGTCCSLKLFFLSLYLFTYPWFYLLFMTLFLPPPSLNT